MKLIIESHCSCTKDFVHGDWGLSPFSGCPFCNGEGIISETIENVISYQVREENDED